MGNVASLGRRNSFSPERFRARVPVDRAIAHGQLLVRGKHYNGADQFLTDAVKAYPCDGRLWQLRAQANDKLGFHDMAGPFFRTAEANLTGKDQKEARDCTKRSERLDARAQEAFIDTKVKDLCTGTKTPEIAKWMGYAAVPAERVDAIFDRLRSLTTSATPDFVLPITVCRNILALEGKGYEYAQARAENLLTVIVEPFYMRIFEKRALSISEIELMRKLITEGEYIHTKVLEIAVDRLRLVEKMHRAQSCSVALPFEKPSCPVEIPQVYETTLPPPTTAAGKLRMTIDKKPDPKEELLTAMIKDWYQDDHEAGFRALEEGLNDPRSFVSAIEHFDRALQALNIDSSDYVGKITALRSLGRHLEVVETGEKALKLKDLDADHKYQLHVLMGVSLIDLYAEDGDIAIAEAEKHLRTAIRLKPGKAIAYNHLSVCLIQRHNRVTKDYLDAVENLLEHSNDLPVHIIDPIMRTAHILILSLRFAIVDEPERITVLLERLIGEIAERIASPNARAESCGEVILDSILTQLAQMDSPLAKGPRKRILDFYLGDRFKGTLIRILALKAQLTVYLCEEKSDEALSVAKEIVDSKEIPLTTDRQKDSYKDAKLYAHDIAAYVMLERAKEASGEERSRLFGLAAAYLTGVPEDFLSHERLSGSLAESFEGMGDYQSAMGIYDKMIERDGGCLVAYSGFARTAYICKAKKLASTRLYNLYNRVTSILSDDDKCEILNNRSLISDMMVTYCGFDNQSLFKTIDALRQAYPEAYSDALELLNDVQKDRILRAFPAKKAEAA